jgi:hypothetical protein
MDSSSALANLSIWYPEQTMNNITAYPWTIKQIGHYGIALTNVRLVNSYKGIGMGPDQNTLQNIRRVVATTLSMGLCLDYNVDICRMEEIVLTPECWVNSGLSATTYASTMRDYVYNNAIGIQLERVDWTYISDITVKGYNKAIVSTKSSQGGANGHMFNLNFTDCYTGYYAPYVNAYGMMLTEGTIKAVVPIHATSGFTKSISINHMKLISTGTQAVLLEGTGKITMENCVVNTNNTTGVMMNDGQLSATMVAFENTKTHIYAKSAADKVILNNVMTSSTLKTSGTSSKFKKYWNGGATTAKYEVDWAYKERGVTFTAGDNFVSIDAADMEEVSTKLQNAMNLMASQGGGVVYVPSGRYRLDNAITVPEGIELRGSASAPHHSRGRSTIFYTNYGKNGSLTSTALITLSPTAGIDGFKVYYDQQKGGSSNYSVYGYTARGTGINNYIKNVNFVNSYYQTDFGSYRCDGLYIDGATGFPLKKGVVVGGGSRNGIVRDCQFNIHYFYDNEDYATLSVSTDDIRNFSILNSEAFVNGNTKDQVMYHNFVYGANSGLVIDSGADTFVLAHGSDGCDRSMTARGATTGDVILVNSQLVVLGSGATMSYVQMESSFTGELNMTQTNMWGAPSTNSVYVGNGTLRFSQGTHSASGTYGFRTANSGTLYLDTVNHSDSSGVTYDLYLRGSGSATTFGNFYATGGKKSSTSGIYLGTEF